MHVANKFCDFYATSERYLRNSTERVIASDMSGQVLLKLLAQGRHLPSGLSELSSTATWFSRTAQGARDGFNALSNGRKAATVMTGLAAAGIVAGTVISGPSPVQAAPSLAGQSPALEALAQQTGIPKDQLVQELMASVPSLQQGQQQQAATAPKAMDPASIAQSYNIQPQAAAQLLQTAQQFGLDPNNPAHHGRLNQAFSALQSGDPSRIKFVGYHLAGKSPGDGVNYDHIGRMFSQYATMT
jgi:hypothetical protein